MKRVITRVITIMFQTLIFITRVIILSYHCLREESPCTLKSLAGESFKSSHIIKQLGRGTIFIGTVEPPKSNKQEKYAGSTIYDDEFPTEIRT
jgi:hypothetical protein